MDAHICQCLTRLATLRRTSPVTVAGDRSLTGELFVEEVLRLARGLRDTGIRTGHVVAICALNSDRYLVWLLAITFVGGIAAPLNYRWSLEEAKYAIEIVRPVMLVTDECLVYWYSEFDTYSMPFLKHRVFMNSSSEDYRTERFATEALNTPVSRNLSLNYSRAPNGAAIVCFTSGTTGKPKGVTLSHSALIVQSLAKVAVIGYCEDDVYLHTAPLCHIGGISSAMAMLMVGACHVMIPKFNAKSAIEAIEQFHVTSFITVPTIMADILSLIRMEWTWKGKERVKKILNGGGGLSAELIKDASIFFPRAKIMSSYGMTETCSSLTFVTLYDPQRENSCHLTSHVPGAVCVGKPAPHIEIKIRLEEGSDHVGRILTRGPHVMLEYWGHLSTKTTNLASDEGWLDTGDIGQMDEFGNIWLVGRWKGRIKSGGENVYPEEVEALLSQHPGVHAVVVVGVPDARLSEMVVACVRPTEDWRWIEHSFDHYSQSKNKALSSHMLQQFCRDKYLTGFKIPKVFIMWEKQFPTTTTGKLRREEVRSEVISRMRLLPSSL